MPLRVLWLPQTDFLRKHARFEEIVSNAGLLCFLAGTRRARRVRDRTGDVWLQGAHGRERQPEANERLVSSHERQRRLPDLRLDQLAPFAKVVTRRMFGGIGLYDDGLFFGLIDDDTLYFKVDESNRSDYTARGCEAFQPLPDDPTRSMNYFSVPEDVLEDADVLAAWARKSLRVAAAAAAAKVLARAGNERARRRRTPRHAV